MIIKTLSRKKPSFFQLYDYMLEGCDDKDFIITHNLTHSYTRHQVLNQFNKNHNLLKQMKGANSMYHDVISLPNIKDISIERQKEAITILADKYLEKRAEDNIAIGYIHTETNNLHLHLMISSNPKNEPNRHRLSKVQLKEIQIEMEIYKQQEFPELGQELIYTKEREIEEPNYQSSKSKDNEYKQPNRTQEPTRNEQIREIINECIIDSYSKKQLINKLKKHNLELYERGETAGIIDLEEQSKGKTKVKHRFKTLGLELEYENLLEFEKSKELDREIEDELEMEKSKELDMEIEDEMDGG